MTPQPAPRILAVKIKQPLASLVAHGVTEMLTFSQPTTWRGPLAIFADKTWNMREQFATKDKRALNALTPHYGLDDYDLPRLPRGAIVALGRLADCLSTDNPANVPDKQSDDFYFGNFISGRWIWRLQNIQKLEIPIRCSSSTGLWVPEEDVIERLEILL